MARRTMEHTSEPGSGRGADRTLSVKIRNKGLDKNKQDTLL